MNEIHNKELMKIYKHLDGARSGIYDYLVSIVRENENKDIK